MPKKKSTIPSSSAFSDLSQLQQIQAALPVARELVLEGISTFERLEESTIDRVYGLLNDPRLEPLLNEMSDDHQGLIAEAVGAGMALGIALGLMLRPEFLKGGAR